MAGYFVFFCHLWSLPRPLAFCRALIGIGSGYAAQKRKSNLDKVEAAEKKKADITRQRREAEMHLRRLYELNHGPLLKAACKLSERLYTLVEDQNYSWSDDDKPYSGKLYTAYLFGKYVSLFVVSNISLLVPVPS